MKKTKKIVLIAGAILLLFSLAIGLGEVVLRHKVERALADLRLGEFRITTERVSIDPFRKSVTLKGIEWKTEERNRALPPDSLLSSTVQFLDARIERVSVSGISIKQLKKRTLAVRSVLIDGPRGTIVTRSRAVDSAGFEGTKKSKPFRFDVGRLTLSGGSFDWRRITADDTLKCLLNGLRADIFDIRNDSLRQISFGEKTEISLANLLYTFGHRAYDLSLDSLIYRNTASELFVDSVALIPRYSKWDFPRKSVEKSDYMALELRGFSVHGLKMDSLLNKGVVKADSVHLASGNFTSAKDRNAAVPVRVKPMLHTTLQQLGLPIDIGKVKIDDFDAAYEETAPNRTTAGRVTFEGIDATILGATNRVERADQYIEVVADARLMGTGALNAVIFLPVNPDNDHFEVKATLGTTSMPVLNRMIRPLTGMEIQSGTIDRMDFILSGNGRSASAAMTLRYRGLELDVLKLKNGRWQERGGLSELVNRLAVRADNPDERGLRQAQVIVVRDVHRSAFNYLWKGVSAGAMETAETGLAKRLTGKQERASR